MTTLAFLVFDMTGEQNLLAACAFHLITPCFYSNSFIERSLILNTPFFMQWYLICVISALKIRAI